MKALNRAIARTVSQIARHAGEGCHVPMIMALENHLDALLTMERKMLEGVQDVEFAVPSDGGFAPQGSQYWTPERVAVFNRWENAQPPWGNAQPTQHANDNEQPEPDVVDMTDPANWQEGDILLRTGHDWAGFYKGREYLVAKVRPEDQEIYIARNDGLVSGYTFNLLREDQLFKWLRHSEVQS